MASHSIIIPFFKDYAFIGQAVNSVLMQGLSDFEIIVVNDNPGEFSQSFLAELKFPEDVKIVTHQTNRGLSAARNTGLASSSGDFIAYLDADDYFLPGGLARQFEVAFATGCDVTHATTILRERKLSGGILQHLNARDRQLFCKDIERASLADMPELQFIISSWKSVYRRDHLEKTGILFDEEQKKFEDRLYVLENAFSGASFALMSEPSRVWRRRSGSITTSEKSTADLVMMTNLIDKCTSLAERAVRDQLLADVYLKREVFHSVARLIWDTDILEAAIPETDSAPVIRKILERAISRASLEPAIFSDPVIANIERTGRPNPKGLVIDRSRFLDIGRLIAEGNWSALAAIYPTGSGGQEPLSVSTGEGKPARRWPAGPSTPDLELIIHIGLHKTGTTYLQNWLVRHRDQLQANGWLFPRLGFTDHQGIVAKAATPGHQGILRAALNGDERFLKNLISEVEESGCNNLLISCENLSFPFLSGIDRAGNVATIDNYFSGFEKRRVIASIRQPAAYFEALYRERVTNSHLCESRSALQFIATHGETMLSFATMLEPWKRFAGGNLDLLSYDEMRKEPDYFNAVCRSLGINIKGIAATGGRIYASPGRDAVEMVRAINAIMPPGKIKTATVQSFMNIAGKIGGDNRGLSVLPPQIRIELTDYAQSQSEKFFVDCGLNVDFDQIRADIEKEKESWASCAAPDRELVEALIHTKNIVDSRAVGSGIGTVRATRGTRGVLIRKFSAWFQRPTVKSRLVAIYNRLPTGARKMARKAYSRVTR